MDKLFNFPFLKISKLRMIINIIISFCLNDISKVYVWSNSLAFQGRKIIRLRD